MAAPTADVLYDEVPYPGHPFAQTHPDRLASIGRLYGLDCPAPASCRLLELGCGDGGNLLPMACALPGARFVGIDISGDAIAAAQARAQAAGVENVTFEAASLADFAPPAASFDYVIAHGVFSWVPEEIREALMALCAHALAEHGVAYVSYNTLPGGHMRDIVRNILKAHVAEDLPAAQQLAAARELLDVLRTAWAYDEQLSTLISLAAKMREDSDALLFHDTLSPINRRLHFDEFVAYTERHELQFLAEANFWEMQVGWLPPALRDGVLATDDRLRREALLDQLRMRTFRQSLLCHAAHELGDPPGLERLEGLAISIQAQVSAPGEDGRVTFTGANGSNLTTDHAAVIAALRARRRGLAGDPADRRAVAGGCRAGGAPAHLRGAHALLQRRAGRRAHRAGGVRHGRGGAAAGHRDGPVAGAGGADGGQPAPRADDARRPRARARHAARRHPRPRRAAAPTWRRGCRARRARGPRGVARAQPRRARPIGAAAGAVTRPGIL